MSYCLFEHQNLVTCILESVYPGKVISSKGCHVKASIEVSRLSVRFKFCAFVSQCLHENFVEPKPALHENYGAKI